MLPHSTDNGCASWMHLSANRSSFDLLGIGQEAYSGKVRAPHQGTSPEPE